MAGYLLNLTAKNPTSATSADGLFNANSVDNTSRVWFRVPDTWPGIVFDPNHGAPWPVGVAAPLSSWVRVPNTDDAALPCQVGDKFYIRIAPVAVGRQRTICIVALPHYLDARH